MALCTIILVQYITMMTLGLVGFITMLVSLVANPKGGGNVILPNDPTSTTAASVQAKRTPALGKHPSGFVDRGKLGRW